MGDASRSSLKIGDTGVIELTGKIMVVAIVLLCFVIFFVFCLHLYAKWFWYRRQEEATTTTTRRRRRLDFAAGQQELAAISALRRGLDPSVLNTLPVVVFDPKDFKDGLECAVCLSEVSDGEKARVLPKCSHGFHVECIDMWFESHSTCPLCRDPIPNYKQSSSCGESSIESVLQAHSIVETNVLSTEAPNFPTNVLIWGNETQVSTFGPSVEENHQSSAGAEPSTSSSSSGSRPDGVSVIDIPRQMNEEDEQKSPVPTRLRSLKRLLSGSRRINPSTPRNVDLEQGGRIQC